MMGLFFSLSQKIGGKNDGEGKQRGNRGAAFLANACHSRGAFGWQKVKAGKISAFVVGIIAIILGIIFKNMNVAFLVGWAFAVAASANLPSIIMLLFWKKTTAKGIAWSIGVGMISSLGIILTSPSMYTQLYHLEASAAPHPLNNPGIISIPLSFLTLVVVSLMTQKKK
jgi:cation/acetate symporter